MVPPRMRSGVSNWLAARSARYTQAIVALAFNVPLMVAALSRYPQELSWYSVEGGYAAMVFAGYYVLLVFALLTLAFLLTGAWPRLFLVVSAAILALTLYYFAIDGAVYRVARMHIDAFWLGYLVTTFDGIGIGAWRLTGAAALLAAIVTLEAWLLRVARRVTRRALWSTGLPAVCLTCLVITQVVHVAAYERNDARFTGLTPQLPFYFPVTSHANAVKYSGHLSMIRELGSDETRAGESLRYPLADVGCHPDSGRLRRNVLVLLLESWRADAMDSVVTPRIHAFARGASYFLQHYSSGNSTRSGVYPLFYGIHPTYWTAISASNARIHNPVLIDALEENGYAFGILANSHFKQHKIKDAVFRDIPIEESFSGTTADARDRDMTERMFAFMAEQRVANKPFFGFAFYKATHYPYEYPAGDAPFQPAAELAVLDTRAADNPSPVVNDYHNAVHYVDGLIGNLLERMRAAGMLENTIVIVTSDHGEQFNDRHDNTWIHGGNFTRYLTRVPLIIHVPGKPARRVAAITSEVDIAPTILQEGLRCGWNSADYSNGLNLFGALPHRRPIVVGSYVDHALILGRDVFVTGPMYTEHYDLDGGKGGGGRPDMEMLRQAMSEMTRFYGGPQPRDTARVVQPGSPTGLKSARAASRRGPAPGS